MSDRTTLENIEEHLTFFNKMYDVVRIVDPLCKRVVEYSESSLVQMDNVCYKYWENGRICDNCISIRAHNENKTFMKLEQTEDVTMLVTAVPIDNVKSPIVVELLRNATDTMLIGEGDYNKGHMIKNLVDNINQKVIIDSLTSLKNRRFINERLPTDIIKATIKDWPLSVIFMDVDNLKNINDTYGHTIGDYTLKEVGNSITKFIRDEMDWSARYGGDEFLICLNNVNYIEAQLVADKIRNKIEEILVPGDNDFINLSVSIGIHTMKEIKLTAEELINEADKKMYKAKRSKNQ